MTERRALINVHFEVKNLHIEAKMCVLRSNVYVLRSKMYVLRSKMYVLRSKTNNAASHLFVNIVFSYKQLYQSIHSSVIKLT